MVEIVGLYVIRTTFDQTGTIQCLNKTKRDMEETNEVNTERRKRENRSSLTFSWFAGKLAVRWAIVLPEDISRQSRRLNDVELIWRAENGKQGEGNVCLLANKRPRVRSILSGFQPGKLKGRII